MKKDQNIEVAGFQEGFENFKNDFWNWLKVNWKWVLGIGAGVGITAYLLRRKKDVSKTRRRKR